MPECSNLMKLARVSLRNRLACAVILLCALVFAVGCSTMNTDGVDVEYATNGFPIARIGVCGPLSTAAANEFMYAGYAAQDLGPDIMTSMDDTDGRMFKYMAIAGTVVFSTPDPLGFSSYVMRVVDLTTGETLWESEGVNQDAAAMKREDRPVSEAFREMVRDFSRAYPPQRSPAPGASGLL